MLDGHCGIDDWEITFIEKGRNKLEQKLEQKSFFDNTSLTHLHRMVSMSD